MLRSNFVKIIFLCVIYVVDSPVDLALGIKELLKYYPDPGHFCHFFAKPHVYSNRNYENVLNWNLFTD